MRKAIKKIFNKNTKKSIKILDLPLGICYYSKTMNKYERNRIIMNISLKGRSFLTLLDFSPQEIRYLLDLAHALKKKKKDAVTTDPSGTRAPAARAGFSARSPGIIGIYRSTGSAPDEGTVFG